MCRKKAEWTIIHGLSPDDYTEACTDHVGDLLTDAKEHRIYQFFGDTSAQCCFSQTEAGNGGGLL